MNDADEAQQNLREREKRPFVIEGSFFAMNSVTGIARLWKQVFLEWRKSGFLDRVVMLDRDGTAPDIDGLRKIVIPVHDYSDLSQDPALLQMCCDELNAAVFCSTYYAYPQTTPTLAVMYDMIPELLRYDFSDPMWAEKCCLINRAQHFVCISENTRRDLLQIYPFTAQYPVDVGLCGVSTLYDDTKRSTQTPLSAYGIDQDYVLFVGGNAPYKGRQTLVQALAKLPKDVRPLLVAVSMSSDIEEEIIELLGEDGIRVLYVTDEGLRILYEGALAYVCPSYYEGFGLTLLEAMSCGCPVISSDGGSLPEVAGDAAWMFPAGDADKLAEAIAMIADPRISNQLIMRGYRRIQDFSWSDIAGAIRDGLLSLAGELPPAANETS